MDLSGKSQVELSFWWQEFNDENNSADGVFIRSNSDEGWCQVFSFNDGPAVFTEAVIDLTQATSDCGIAFSDDFQVMFQFIGYYYYYNYFWVDDIQVEGCGGCAEYAELEEDISLGAGQEMVVTFPGWTPSEWHNESFQDTWEDYPVHGFTIMEGDQRP